LRRFEHLRQLRSHQYFHNHLSTASQSKNLSAKHLARPIGRNQTKARIPLVSLGVGIALDQPVKETAKTLIARERGQGSRLEAMSRQPALAFFASFAVPFPCFDAIPPRHDPCGKGFGETARYGK
jgi:hypothetical protein